MSTINPRLRLSPYNATLQTIRWSSNCCGSKSTELCRPHSTSCQFYAVSADIRYCCGLRVTLNAAAAQSTCMRKYIHNPRRAVLDVYRNSTSQWEGNLLSSSPATVCIDRIYRPRCVYNIMTCRIIAFKSVHIRRKQVKSPCIPFNNMLAILEADLSARYSYQRYTTAWPWPLTLWAHNFTTIYLHT